MDETAPSSSCPVCRGQRPRGVLQARRPRRNALGRMAVFWLAACPGLCAAALPPHHPKATLRCRRSRCHAAPRLRRKHDDGFGLWDLPFMFLCKTSVILLAYTSHEARCAAAGAASVPALQRSRRDAPSSGTPDLPRLPALRDRRPHASGSQAPPPAARVHVPLAGLSASRVPSLLVRG